MMRRQPLFLAASALIFLAASCDNQTSSLPDNPERTPATEDTNEHDSSVSDSPIGAWKLESGRGPHGEIPIVDDWEITLEISDGRIAGRSACNSYGGRVEIGATSITVRGLGGTLIRCEGDVALAEERYLSAIKSGRLDPARWRHARDHRR